MNTSSKIKMFIIQKINHTYVSKDTSCFATYKMGAVNKLTLKMELIIFTMISLILKFLNQKIDKKSYKHIGIYNIGYITIKKLMIVKILAV